ncbi:DUF4198 domain-containing protein [Anaerobacillus isosaccharinicus]|uniref:DUF4198 domain-containing protein n=1 Tax=Anaerobacillus isosaccharinicus TaxID=1532552 RepID=A0A1S2LGC4_9BACI|nr:DUF4198 domain-containing protein [Anaerobacillus isosaccharinicus]MBA5588676.1 DUF4198 domain-containing protein [Anaerobacillus isosaccharinicus]QOY37919.1 DUF4198 domain-containing protein [Anaerobacillus isosaccharinicus]
MKKTIALTIFILLLLITPKAFAHELFIQVKKDDVSNELQAEVLWGHLRDFLDQANHENYELYVRYPNGETEQLELEKIGVQARAYLNASEKGEYVFWANRVPSTYTPEDDVTRLSVQMAKAIYQVGSGNLTANQPVGLSLEIVPEASLANFKTGKVKGSVLLDGEPLSGATLTAYGPEGELLEEVSSDDGTFEFNLQSNGEWLMKATFQTEESGKLEDTEYELIGQTTTLLVDTTSTSSSYNNLNSTNPLTMIAVFFIGLLLGAAITFVSVKKK